MHTGVIRTCSGISTWSPELMARGSPRVCTGSRTTVHPSVSRSSDHPRIHGEQARPPMPLPIATGSPSYARGADQVGQRLVPGRGITPVCTGSSSRPGWVTPPSGDHPRMHGEQAAVWVCGAVWSGSPPVCTGSRIRFGVVVDSAPDHPRMHGEQTSRNHCSSRRSGSPPYARGAGTAERVRPEIGGITPVCTGSRVTGTARRAGSRDHPRMHGEQQDQRISKVTALGSPPYARGAARHGDAGAR